MQDLLPSYLQNYHNAVSEGPYITRSKHRIKLSQFLQGPKYLRINFFHIALRNGVIQRQNYKYKKQSMNLK